MPKPKLGILGGLGPAAGFHFCSRITELTPAIRDQDHLTMLVWSDPTVPDRTEALLDDGENVVPSLRRGVQGLKDIGADLLVVPCNTAHVWVPDIAAEVGIELINIIDVNVAEIASHLPGGGSVAVLATDATVRSGLYQSAIERNGLQSLELSAEQQHGVRNAIYAVKSGSASALEDVGTVIHRICESLENQGADSILLGCTELSFLKGTTRLDIPIIDSIDTLAQTAIYCAMGNPPRVS